MNAATIRRLQNQRYAHIQRLGRLVQVIEGSLFERTINGRQRFYLSCMQEGKQRQHYVAQRHCPAVRKGVEQYNELVAIVRRISLINLQLVGKEGDYL